MGLYKWTHSRSELMFYQIILALVATPVVLFLGVNWSWLWLTLAITAIFNVCFVEAFTHRFCAHSAYKLSRPIEAILIVLSSVVPGTGSCAGWVANHIAHHKYSDTEKDPHSASHSTLWELLKGKYPNTGSIYSVRYLLDDPLHKSVHLYYVIWMAAWALIWFALFGLNGLYFGVLLPWAIGPLLSGIQNYTLHLHTIGNYRSFDTPDKSQNSPIGHLLSFGAAGWHNNHHAKPGRWNTAFKKYEFDISAWFIKMIKK
jgi:stearoyl-CoA desaturase (delta-9 desaturase)